MRTKSPFPSIEEIIGGDNDTGHSFTLHRTIRSLLPEISYFAISLLILYATEYAAAKLLGSQWRNSIPILGGFSFRWLTVLPIFLLLEIIRKYNDNLYVFERDRVVHHWGLLSLRYKVPAIRYFDIRAMKVKQGILGRILNYGDIELSTSAQDNSEIILVGVYAPRALSSFIEEMRTWHHSSDEATFISRRRNHEQRTGVKPARVDVHRPAL